METNRSKKHTKDIILTAALLLFMVVYLAFLIRMYARKQCFYLAGCVWETRDLNYLVFIVLWVMQIIDRISTIRKTEDDELRQKHIRFCRLFGISAALLILVFGMTVVMNLHQRKNTCYADLNVNSERNLLLAENHKGMCITVYSKKGCILRTLDSIQEFRYAHTNMVADGQYVWRASGDSVTVQFDTGGMHAHADTAEIIERHYTL